MNAFLKEDTRSLYDDNEFVEKVQETTDSCMVCDESDDLDRIEREMTLEHSFVSAKVNHTAPSLPPIVSNEEIMPLIS